MVSSAATRPLGSEFDDFLYAPIGEDNDGMLLTVLSALARLDVDPWEEAAVLNQLPRDERVRRLTSMIAALPKGPSTRPDPASDAIRLSALLPYRAAFGIRSREPGRGAVPAEYSPVINRLFYCALFIVFVLCGHWLAAGL